MWGRRVHGQGFKVYGFGDLGFWVYRQGEGFGGGGGGRVSGEYRVQVFRSRVPGLFRNCGLMYSAPPLFRVFNLF